MDLQGEAREQDYFITNSSDRSIFISSGILEDESKSEIEKLGIFSGIAIHEAAHLLYTKLEDFKVCFNNNSLDSSLLSSSTKDYDKCLVGKFLNKLGITKLDLVYRQSMRFIQKLAGLVEDEQVETNLLEERQGWYDYIEKQKEYYRNNIKKKFTKDIDSSTVDFIEFINTLIDVVRYQDFVEEKVINKYNESFQEVYKILQDPPKSTFESIIKSLQLFKVCIGVLSAQDSKIEDIIVSKEEEKCDEDESPKVEKEFIECLMKALSSKSKVEKTSDLLTRAFDYIDSSCILSSLPVTGSDMTRRTDYYEATRKDQITGLDEETIDLGRGVFSKGTKSDVYFRHPLGEEHEYKKELKEVSQYIPTMRNLVRNMNRNFDFCIHGQRSGKLDTTKLVEAVQGVPQVYTKTGIVRTSGVNICIVIDESGSMGNERSSQARKAAILMNESFGNLPGVELFIYGHTADLRFGEHGKSTDIYIYREPGIPYKYKMGTGLTNVDGRYENRDGVALREIATRVRKFTNQPVLMFVLSDGEPSAIEYRREYAITDTGQAVKEIMSKGFYPIQITIDNSSLGEDKIRKMFSSFIDLTDDLSELPKSLSSVVRKEISKALIENQSLTTI